MNLDKESLGRVLSQFKSLESFAYSWHRNTPEKLGFGSSYFRRSWHLLSSSIDQARNVWTLGLLCTVDSKTWSFPSLNNPRSRNVRHRPLALRCAALNHNRFHVTGLDLKSDEGDSPRIGMLTYLIDWKYFISQLELASKEDGTRWDEKSGEPGLSQMLDA